MKTNAGKLLPIIIALISLASFTSFKCCVEKFKFVFINKESKRLEDLNVKIIVYSKDKTPPEMMDYKTDDKGVFVIDVPAFDSLKIIVNPKYEYCSFEYPYQQTFVYKGTECLDSNFIKIDYTIVEEKNVFSFYFRPNTTICSLEEVTGNPIEMSCECYKNSQCKYLAKAVEMIKCNNKLQIELIGNCTEKEFKKKGDKLVTSRLELIKSILIANGIRNEIITPINHGMKQPKIKQSMLKYATKSQKEEANIVNTYVLCKISKR